MMPRTLTHFSVQNSRIVFDPALASEDIVLEDRLLKKSQRRRRTISNVHRLEWY